MIKNLGAIYSGDDGGGDNPPVKSAPKTLEGARAYSNQTAPYAPSGSVEQGDISGYLPYMPDGVYTNRKPIDFIRGENQSVWEQLGKRSLDIIPNVAGGLMQFFGVMGSLATEWGKDDKDYTNPLVDASNAIHNFGGWGDIYRENNNVFAPSDPGWWIDNLGQLADSSIPFAIGGAGVAGILEKAAMGIGDLVNLGANGIRIARGAAQLGTAAYMSYAEGAQAGAQVFQGVYAKQYQNGIDNGLSLDDADKQAKTIASSSAASTVQLNTILGTALNLSSVAPFFRKSEDIAGTVLERELRQKAGESTAEWAARVKNLSADQFTHDLIEHHGWKSYLWEGVQEGSEEVMNNFTQNTGEEEGEKGNVHGFWDQFGQLEHWFDRTWDQQGALAFVLGAAGGIANTIAVSHLPHQYTSQYEDGQHQKVYTQDDEATGAKAGDLKFDRNNAPVYQKHFASPHNIDKWGKLQAFNSVKDSLASDVEEYKNLQDNYFDAVKTSNPVALDTAKQAMFNPLVFNAVKQGMVAPWVEQFQKIGEMTPEEAQAQGYGDDYKQQAQKAVSQLQEAGQEYDKLKTRYGLQWEANEGAKQVLDMVFHKKVELMQWDNMIKDHEGQLAKSRAEESAEAKLQDPQGYDSSVDNYNRKLKSARMVQQVLQRDWSVLKDALDTKDYQKAASTIRKYRPKGLNDGDLESAIQDTAGKLNGKIKQLDNNVKEAEDGLYTSSGYQQFQADHPGKTFGDFMQSVQKGMELNQQNLFHQISIDHEKARYEIAAKNYAEITQEKTLNRFIKKANDWQDKLAKERQAQEAEELADIQSNARDKGTLDRASRISLDAMAARYRMQRDAHRTTAAGLGEELANVRKEKERLSIHSDPLRMSALRRQEKELQRKIDQANQQAAYYDGLNTQYTVDTSTAPVTPDAAKQQAEQQDAAATVNNVQTIPVDPTLPLPEGEQIEEATGIVTDPTIPLPELVITPVAATTTGTEFQSTQQYQQQMDSDPTIAYARELETLTPEGRNYLAELEQKIRSGEIAFSYNLLNTQVTDGDLTQPQAASLLLALKNYIDQNPTIAATTTTISTVSNTEELKQQAREDFDNSEAGQKFVTFVENFTERQGDEEQYDVDDDTYIDEVNNFLSDLFEFKPDRFERKSKKFRLYANGKEYISNGRRRSGAFSGKGKWDMNGDDWMALAHSYIDAKVDAQLAGLNQTPTDNTADLERRFGTYRVIQNYDRSIAAETDLEERQRLQQERLNMLHQLEEEQGPERSLSEILENAVGVPTPSEPSIDVASVEVTDSPVIAFTDDSMIEQEGWRHLGRKTDDALTLANTTFATVRDVQDKQGNIRKEVDKDQINPQYNQDLLDSTKLLPNTSVYYEVVTDYEGFTKDYNSLEVNEAGDPVSTGVERFTDYADDKGHVKSDDHSIGNFPIRVVDRESGKTVGWVKKTDFLNAKFPNTNDYRNIQHVTYDKDGNTIDNLKLQNERLMKLRELIARQHNAGTGTHIEGNTRSKGAGSIIYNRIDQFNSKDEKTGQKLTPGFAVNPTHPELSLLPDTSLELGVVHKPAGSKGEVHTRYKTPTGKELANSLDGFSHGSVVVLLPGANGTFQVASLSGQKLADNTRQSSVRTVARAIELYLKNDGSNKDVTEEIAKLRKNTDHDISTAKGLRAFINQYFTYTQPFKDSETLASGSGKEEFLFRIGEANLSQSKGEIRLGWRNSGRTPVSAKLVNGQLDPAFINALLEGFKTRARAVVYTDPTQSLRGINEAGTEKFKDAIYTSNGEWRHKAHPSYNEYVKSFSKTIVYGRNKLSNGGYNYVANPTISYDYQDPAAFPTLEESQQPATGAIPSGPQAMEESDLDFFNSVMGLSNNAPLEIGALGTAPDNSRPLSLATLQEMYNFTAEALRNGRTPAELFDQLSRTGVTWLSEGYNPFTRCL